MNTNARQERIQRLLIIFMLVTAGIMLALLQSTLAYSICVTECVQKHTEQIAFTAGDPWRFRPLTPFVIEVLTPNHTAAGIMTSYTLAHTLLIPLALILLYTWLHHEHSSLTSFLGAGLLIFYMPLVFLNDYALGLWSIVELILLLIGMLSLDRPWAFGTIVFLATLNRETAILLPIAWSLWHWDELRSGKGIRAAIAYFAVWGITYLALRLLIGYGQPVVTLAEGWQRNTVNNIWKTAIVWAMILPVIMAALIGYSSSDRRVKRLLLVAVCYLPLYLAFGLWHEIRLLLACVPFVFPTALHAIVRE